MVSPKKISHIIHLKSAFGQVHLQDMCPKDVRLSRNCIDSHSKDHDTFFVVVVVPILFSLYMMTSSNGNIFRVTGPLCGEFTGPGEFPAQRPVTRSFDVFFDLRLNKRLSKQPWGWWFETPAWSLWRQRNEPNRQRLNSFKWVCTVFNKNI